MTAEELKLKALLAFLPMLLSAIEPLKKNILAEKAEITLQDDETDVIAIFHHNKIDNDVYISISTINEAQQIKRQISISNFETLIKNLVK